MAEEEVEDQEATEPVVVAKPPSLLRYLPFVLVILLLQAAGAYFLVEEYFFSTPELGLVAVEEPAGRPRTVPDTDEPVTSVELGDILVNPRNTQARLLVRANVTLGVAPKAVKQEIESDLLRDRVRDAVIAAISNVEPESLRTPEGRDRAKEDIKNRVNAFLYEGQVLEVYFGEFLMRALPGYRVGGG